jgi:putative hemolysin
VGDGLVLQLLLLGALIVCSGLLSGAEAAYFSLGRARLRKITADRPEGAPAPVVSRPHDLLVTLLVGITVINIGASALATHVAHFVVGPRWGLVVELITMIVLLTTFGEVLPMTLAVKYPERFLAVVERPVRWLGWLLTPIRGVLAGFTALTVRLLGRGAEGQAALSEEELRTLVE